jgi:anti-sigma regulatory factor (Ser/Thr protein kinase)
VREFDRYELSLPAGWDAELVAAGTTDRIASLAGLDEKTTAAVRLAVIEACINVFEQSPDQEIRVNLTFVVDENKLLVIFRDTGSRPDAGQLGPEGIREQLEQLRPGGWRLLTIKSIDPGA